VGSTPTLGTINSLEVFTISTNLARNHLSPKMPDGAKMGAPLTRLPFELDHIASRLCEFVHGFFQSLWSAASVSARHGLNVVT